MRRNRVHPEGQPHPVASTDLPVIQGDGFASGTLLTLLMPALGTAGRLFQTLFRNDRFAALPDDAALPSDAFAAHPPFDFRNPPEPSGAFIGR